MGSMCCSYVLSGLQPGVPAMLALGGVTQLRYNIDSLFKPDPVDFDSSCCALMIHNIYICDVCRLYLLINKVNDSLFGKHRKNLLRLIIKLLMLVIPYELKHIQSPTLSSRSIFLLSSGMITYACKWKQQIQNQYANMPTTDA